MTMGESVFTPEELEEASRYRIVIQWSEDDQLFLVSLPEFGGVRSHGCTIVEAAERGVELAAEWIDAMRTLGEPIPAPAGLAAAS
jgi:predicted RNase H-like HicB family nuclease